MKWNEYSLNEIGSVNRGKSKHRPRDAAHLFGGPYPFIQTGDVKHSNLYITSYSQTYSEAGLRQSKLWQKGTLCITIAANIADTAILNIDACFPDSVIGFIPDEDKCDVKYIKYKFDLLQSQFKQFSQGAAQDNLSLSKLNSLKFTLPPLPIQKKIAAILSAYDDLIENNLKRIALLEKSAKLLYEEWFVRLRFPGCEHTRIVDGVPERWEKKPLSNYCESVNYGYTASAIHEPIGPKFLRITDIVPSVIEWDSVPYCEIPENRKEKFLLKEGDIVVARTGATTGYAKRLHKKFPESVFASYLIRLRIRDGIDDILVGTFVESEEYKKFIKNNASGAAQAGANAKVATSIELLLPPAELQKAFRDIVEPLCDKKELLVIQNQKLKQARDILLPKLINGEIAV